MALLDYCSLHGIGNYKIAYLYTTKAVLDAVEKKEINLGQFAIVNSVGGLVGETIAELGRHYFETKDAYTYEIHHCLLAKKGVIAKDIKKIMAHDQALKQCTQNLQKNYSDFKIVAGDGDLADTAQIAQAIADGRLGGTAVIGPRYLSKIFSLEVLGEDLQDSNKNITTFLLVSAGCL